MQPCMVEEVAQPDHMFFECSTPTRVRWQQQQQQQQQQRLHADMLVPTRATDHAGNSRNTESGAVSSVNGRDRTSVRSLQYSRSSGRTISFTCRRSEQQRWMCTGRCTGSAVKWILTVTPPRTPACMYARTHAPRLQAVLFQRSARLSATLW
jgi:hypothetical protein